MTDQNPYAAPKSEVNASEVPISELAKVLSLQKLRLAAWFAIASMLLGSIGIIVSAAGANQSMPIRLTVEGITWITTAMWIYCMVVLVQLLAHRFKVEGLKPYLFVFIVLELIETLLSMFFEPTLTDSVVTIVYFALFVPYGIVIILLSRKIIKCRQVYAHLKAFAWLYLLCGVSWATIVLFLIGIPLLFIATIFLALSFFQAGREITNNSQ